MKVLLLVLLLAGCSTHKLKYKYSFSKSYLASLTDEETQVAKIEISVKDPLIFASGMDSTYVMVRLLDKKGQELLNVDPMDLTLSTSEDIEAKPFSLKQGWYKAEILPRVKSPSVSMQVDWLEKMMSQEIFLKTVSSPIKNHLSSTNTGTETQVFGEIDVTRKSRVPASFTERFSFENIGKNRIVKSLNSSRDFTFEYLEQARQNISFEVHDAPSDQDSQRMLSHFMIFPRKKLPTVEQLDSKIVVGLANGEKIVFQKDSKEIIDGVFQEGPVDANRDRMIRRYPDFRYTGKGVLLRANSRGQSPQIANYEKDKIDQQFGVTGSAEVLILNGSTGQRCRRPKSEFWEPLDVSPIEFKFATDEALDTYLKLHCGFGIPKL
jgi:hypothetical protein